MKNLISFAVSILFSFSAAAVDPTAFTVTPPPTLTSKAGLLNKESVNGAITSCDSAAEKAHYACLANLSPKIQTAGAMIGGLLGAAKVAKSSSESCGKYNEAMKIAETALLAYNSLCTGAMVYCNSVCSGSITTNKGAEAAVRTEIDSLARAVDPDKTEIAKAQADVTLLESTNGALGVRIKTCSAFKMNLAAAGVGLLGVITQSKAQSGCQTDTTVADCTKNPQNPLCKTGIDCSVASNAGDTQCICQRAPNSQGCPGYNNQQSGIAPTKTNTDGMASTEKADYGTPSVGGGADSKVAAPGASGSGGSAMGGGSGGGGGGGLGGSGGAGKAGAADSKANANKGLNPNILSGYEGGGGGGGGRGGSGRPDSAYNAYLPGGAKDPNRGVASKTSGNGEVTTAGSKSNWEKVSERYKDNKPTLMGQ